MIKDSDKEVINGPRNWGTGFMPAVHQGVEFSATGSPIRNLAPPRGVDDARQRDKLDLLASLNRAHAATRACAAIEAIGELRSVRFPGTA